jgi:hypothetical protein
MVQIGYTVVNTVPYGASRLAAVGYFVAESWIALRFVAFD